MEVILAIDIGSSSIRCSAHNGQTLSLVTEKTTSHVTVQAVAPNTGKVNLHTDEGAFLDLVDRVVDETIRKLDEVGKDYTIVALGFASFVMNLVGVNAGGELVGPEATMTYACNWGRVSQEVSELKSSLGKETVERIYQRTGAPIHSAYALAQLRALYTDGPDLVQSVTKWQTLPSLCLARWTGTEVLPISFSEASWTGLLNYQTCEYETSVLDLLPENCREALPELADFDELSLSLSDKYDSRWPQLRQARLFLGLGDGACANVGSKCSTASRIACTVGTSAAARVCLPLSVGEHVHVEPGLFCYRVNRSHVLVGGALTDGGSVVEWVCQLVNLSSSESFSACMKKVVELADSDLEGGQNRASRNLCVVPFLSGERSTGFRTGATGSMLGLTRETTPAHLLKACLEGLALRISAILGLLESVVETKSEDLLVVASGKALERNDALRQMLSDSSGLRVALDQDAQEGTSRGVVVLVASALGVSENACEEELVSPIITSPRSEARSYWDRAKSDQEALIDAVSPLFMNDHIS